MTTEKLVEDLATPASPNVATTDENLSVDTMFQQVSMPSLGRQIFSVLPIHGPTAALFNIRNQNNIIAVAQVYTITPTAVDSTVYTLTIDGIAYSYTSGIGATVAQITAGLALEINVTQTNGIVPVTAVDNTTNITLTADVAGVAFTATDTGAGTLVIVPTQPNVVANSGNDFELVRADVTVKNSASIATGITQEVVHDLRSQFGKETAGVIGKLLRGLANDAENTDTIAFLEANALAGTTLLLSNSANAETNLFEITQRVHELVLAINSNHLRSYEAFAVVPYVALGGIMGLSKYVGGDNKSERGLFIAKVGQTKFYLNPDATATNAYVGLKDTTNPSKSSAVFSPYVSNIIDAIDSNTGNSTYHIFNRYAITASPLHVAGEEMLHKFAIQL